MKYSFLSSVVFLLFLGVGYCISAQTEDKILPPALPYKQCVMVRTPVLPANYYKDDDEKEEKEIARLTEMIAADSQNFNLYIKRAMKYSRK